MLFFNVYNDINWIKFQKFLKMPFSMLNNVIFFDALYSAKCIFSVASALYSKGYLILLQLKFVQQSFCRLRDKCFVLLLYSSSTFG